MTPRICVGYGEGFGGSVHWLATLKLGARGDLRCSWFDGAEREVKLDRYAFALEAELFEAVGRALQPLPKTVGMSMDDADHAWLEWAEGDVTRRTERILTRKKPDALEREFCRLFDSLYALVRPALLAAGAAELVISRSDSLVTAPGAR